MRIVARLNGRKELCEITKVIERDSARGKYWKEIIFIQAPPNKMAYVIHVSQKCSEEILNQVFGNEYCVLANYVDEVQEIYSSALEGILNG